MLEKIVFLTTKWPKAVLLTAILILAAAGWYGAGVFSDLTHDDGFSIPGTESADVAEIIAENFSQAKPSGILLFESTDPEVLVTNPEFKAEVETIIADIDPQPIQALSYYTTGQDQLISKDKTKTYAALTFEGDRDKQIEILEHIQQTASTNLANVNVGGELLTNHQASIQVEKDLQKAEIIALPILAMLLLVFFRSPIAAALPIILGISAIVGALAVVRLLAQFFEIDQYAVNVITILGLGLAVDYSLLMVNRFKEELTLHNDTAIALRRTVLTSGRTIFFSGITVATCLLVLYIFPIGFLRSVGLGGASALLVAVIAALVIMPALLALFGKNLNKWTIGPRKKINNKQETHSIWIKTGAFTLRHPLPVLLVTGAIVLAIAYPFKHVVFTEMDYRSLAESSSSYKVAESLSNDFASNRTPINVIYQFSDNSEPEDINQVYDLSKNIADLSGVETVESATPLIGQSSAELYKNLYLSGQLTPEMLALRQRYLHDDMALIVIQPDPSLSGEQEQELVKAVRKIDVKDGSILVGGQPAVMVDTLSSISNYLPTALIIMAVAIFILFTLLLQSVVIPLKTIIINAFTLLATFGLLTLVFQDGWLTEQTWLSHTGGLQPTIPILIFAVAFGLSMDYAAFLYGRMHEEYVKSQDNDTAVLTSLDKTGSIITAAAILLFVVVAAFATSQIALIQQVGFGLSVAVLLDAFIIRMFLVPAIMKLLGHINWYAPRWLKRWHIKHE